ncbi:Snf7-domain-containing protein [Infundibulicybe gibba]|nr:Snf7-domain-containing protein [Infundibulicybe gibba]
MSQFSKTELFSTTSRSRMQALYSDISRQKQSNPTAFHSNIEWWRKALEFILRNDQQQEGGRLVLHAGRSLMETLKVEGVGKPLAIGAVVVPRQSIYDAGWLPGRIVSFVVGKPLWWALETMGVVGEESMFRGSSQQAKETGWWGDYVFVSQVEAAAEAVLEKQSTKAGTAGDRLYTLDSFTKEFSSFVGGGTSDIMVLIKYLERDRQVITVDKSMIKFIETESGALEAQEISAVDHGILELKNAVDNLRAQVNGLQRKIDECTQKASIALQQKHKSVALSYIRSRKELGELLSKRLASLATLESTFITVEAAAGDIEIMRSYESSTSTLRAILAHPSLQRDSIDKTMEAMAEANADAREMDDAIRIGGEVAVGVEVIDDGELEEELEALIQEAESKTSQDRLTDHGMQAPTTMPGSNQNAAKGKQKVLVADT